MSGMFVESLSIAVIMINYQRIIINYQRFMIFLFNYGFPKGGYSIGSCSSCKSCAERLSPPMVSKRHPQGKVVFTALQKGLGGTASARFNQPGLKGMWHDLSASFELESD
ncbi:hypothetical protein [Agarivorans sp. Z349TD_8]|uniref:hypothetical protein n=1 Tax=Agarivorans sp. Z349TD_8 TaxID=3421434 RepID=UPI003D7C7F8D